MQSVTFHVFCFDRRLRRHLQEDVVRDLCSSASALQDLETEFSQLQEDREILRRIIPSGNSKVRTLSCTYLLRGNLQSGPPLSLPLSLLLKTTTKRKQSNKQKNA